MQPRQRFVIGAMIASSSSAPIESMTEQPGNIKNSRKLWVPNQMMGESYMMAHRPRCCKCGGVAVGRVCYAGLHNKIIDNPFCQVDFAEIYHQTGILLDELFGVMAVGDFILIQRWKYTEVIPPMPETYSELMHRGLKRK